MAGALTGAAGTIFAGWLAWSAAWQGVLNQQRPQTEALAILVGELRPLIEHHLLVWRIIDRAAADSPQNRDSGVHLIQTISPARDNFLQVKLYLEKMSPLLEPHRARALSDVLAAMELLQADIDRGPRNNRGDLWLVSLRTRLTFLCHRLPGIDTDLAKVFDGRIKAAIDTCSDSEHLKPLVDEYVQTGLVN